MFRNLLSNINLATGFITFIALAGVMILISFYLENILGLKIMHVGLLMGIVPVMLGIISPFSEALSDRAGTRPITMIGIAVLLIGYLTASTLNQDTTVFDYLIRMFAVGLMTFKPIFYHPIA